MALDWASSSNWRAREGLIKDGRAGCEMLQTWPLSLRLSRALPPARRRWGSGFPSNGLRGAPFPAARLVRDGFLPLDRLRSALLAGHAPGLGKGRRYPKRDLQKGCFDHRAARRSPGHRRAAELRPLGLEGRQGQALGLSCLYHEGVHGQHAVNRFSH